MKQLLSLATFLLFIAGVSAQNIVTKNDSIVVRVGNDTLELPWASGLNSAQLSPIDFNHDGFMDLFVFESNTEANFETGDKIYPFINQGIPGVISYKYAPEYRLGFPVLEEYALLRDYNCDGEPDIFTRDVRQRMTVYKNTTSGNQLSFSLATQVLKTDTSGIPKSPNYFHYGEIFWSYPDLPSITDIDGDGDLDILSAAINPHFTEYNKNMSLELYGTCDSLSFKVKNTCWGSFLEDTNAVALNTCDAVNVPNPEIVEGKKNDKSGRHSHDALLALDLNGDGVMDLIEGDAGRPYLYSFINGGTKTSSKIVSYTETFPAVDSFNAFNYAHPFYIDVNNDGKDDLIVSVGYDILKDTGSVWLYENTGVTSNPVFKLKTHSFLQGQMIDVGTRSKPVFFDYNQDSLMDLVIGNHGYYDQYNYQWSNTLYTSQLALYKNIGTKQQPAFELVDINFGHLDTIPLNLATNKPARSLHPTFGDLDGDGDEDMIVGDHRGRLHYFENIPIAGEADFHLAQPEFLGIKVGNFATPQLFDLDGDQKLDLIIGEADGNLNYYRNTSTSSINFTLMDANLGKVNVSDDWDIVGYSAPFFFKDSNGVTKMLSGSKPGQFRYYDSIIVADTLTVKFRRLEKSFQNIWDGIFSNINGADIDNDGSPDFITGNQSGGVVIYTSEDSIYIPDFVEHKKEKYIDRLIYPNPANTMVTLKIKCQCNDAFEYRVYDVMGNEIEVKQDDVEVSFDLRNYKSGLYFIRAQNKNRSIVITERFLKTD